MWELYFSIGLLSFSIEAFYMRVVFYCWMNFLCTKVKVLETNNRKKIRLNLTLSIRGLLGSLSSLLLILYEKAIRLCADGHTVSFSCKGYFDANFQGDYYFWKRYQYFVLCLRTQRHSPTPTPTYMSWFLIRLYWFVDYVSKYVYNYIYTHAYIYQQNGLFCFVGLANQCEVEICGSI